jgi:hypothetical protein
MSILRDIRLLVARRLDEPLPVRTAVLDVLNLLDIDLDANGYSPPVEMDSAIRRLEAAILNATDDPEQDEEIDFLDLDDLEDWELPMEDENDEDDS